MYYNFNKISIIGLGMIGTSLAKDIRSNKIAKKLVGYVRNVNNIEFAINSNIVDECQMEIGEEISDSDVIIIAANLGSYKEISINLLPFLNKNITITDVGSVKSFVHEEIIPIFANFQANFIPAHPIAGIEKSGIDSGVNNLFKNKDYIITSEENSIYREKIQLLINLIGAKVKFMNCKEHDKIFAISSHLPHLISFICRENSLYHDYLRISNSDRKMWNEIFFYNKNFISEYLKEYKKILTRFCDNNFNFCQYIENICIKRQEIAKIYNSEMVLYDDEDSINNFFLISPIILLLREYNNLGTGFLDLTKIFINSNVIPNIKIIQNTILKIDKIYVKNS